MAAVERTDVVAIGAGIAGSRSERDHSILIGTWVGGATGVRNDEAGRLAGHDDPDNIDTGSSQDESAWIVEQTVSRLPAVGEEAVRLATTGASDLLAPFGLARFG